MFDLKVQFTRNPTLKYIRVYTNILAILFVFPYYLKYDSLQIICKLHRNKFHTVMCGIVSIFIAFLGLEHYNNILNVMKKSSDPFSYFISGRELSEVIYIVSTLITIWLKSDQLADIIALFQDSRFAYYKSLSRSFKKRHFLIVIFILFSGPFALTLIIMTDIMEASWSSDRLFKKFYKDALELVYLNPAVYNGQYYAFAVICRIIVHYGGIVGVTCMDGVCVTYMLLFYYILEDYTQLIRNPASSTAEIQLHYKSLKVFSKKFNNWLGFVYFQLSLGSFPYFVSKFYEFVEPPNIGRLLQSIFNLCVLLVAMIGGAVIDRKARVTKEWLANPKHNAVLSSHELQILISEVHDCEIGIYGFGLFKFTANLLGSVISLLVTFAVIMLQFKGSRQ